jgi:hypothetical protein
MMKIHLFLALQFMFLSCSEVKHDNKKINESANKKSEKTANDGPTGFVELLVLDELKNSSLLLTKDTVIYFTPDNTVRPISIREKKFFYNRSLNEFHFESSSDLFPSEDAKSRAALVDSVEIYIRSLMTPKIRYVKLDVLLAKSKKLRGKVNATSKIIEYGGKYFFLDNMIMPQAFYMYDAKTDELTEFDIKEKFMEVTDFFLYDIDKDKMPEVFILNIGNAPRDYVITTSIYSIRNDSIKVTAN